MPSYEYTSYGSDPPANQPIPPDFKLCIAEAYRLYQLGRISSADYIAYCDEVIRQARLPGGVCPPIEGVPRVGDPKPIGSMRPPIPPKSVRIRPIINRNRRTPTHRRPTPGDPNPGARPKPPGSPSIGWISLIPDPWEIAQGIDTCLAFRANWTSTAYELCERYKELATAFGNRQREMAGYLKSCKMTAACIQRCSEYLRRLDAAIKVVTGLRDRACRSYQDALAFDCTVSMTGMVLDLQMHHADTVLRGLTGSFNEALDTLDLWDAAIDKFARECGCKQVQWDPIEIPEERRRGDDKFWGGEPAGWKEE